MNHVLVLSFHIDSKHGMHNIYTRPEVINMEYDGKLLALAREKLADINFLMDTIEAKMQPTKTVAKTTNSDLTEGLDRADLEPDITMV